MSAIDTHPLIWGKTIKGSEMLAFARQAKAELESNPRTAPGGKAIGKCLAAGIIMPHWATAAGMVRDLGIPLKSAALAAALPDVCQRFQRAYLAGRWEGTLQSLQGATKPGKGILANPTNAHAMTLAAVNSMPAGAAMPAMRQSSAAPEPAIEPIDPVAAFDAAASREVQAAGGNRMTGMARAVAKNPDLHRQYLAAKNGRATSGSAVRDAGPVDDPIGAFNAAIAAMRPTVKSDGEAVRKVVEQNPELHAAYLKAVNRR